MTPGRREAPDRNLALELVRVTEAGAMAAGRWVGRGDKEGGDGAAVDAMRQLVSSVSMRGVVVIGEGEKDEAPMLYNGEEVGNGDGPECDFAVDPVDGTTLMSKGMPNAIAVLAVAERGAMFDPSAVFYMEKIAVGPDAADVIDITAPIGENIKRVAKARNVPESDLTVCILDRPRHAQLIQEVRDAGARIRLISDGDVAGAIAAAGPDSGTDILVGIGGTPEGIIAAAAMRCMGGAHAGQARPDRRRRAPEGHRRGPRPGPGAAAPRIWCPARTSSSAPPASPTATCCAASATTAAAHHPVDRDALEVGHRPHDRRIPPALQKLREYSSVDFTGRRPIRRAIRCPVPEHRSDGDHRTMADSGRRMTKARAAEYRIEHDTMGEVRVPVDGTVARSDSARGGELPDQRARPRAHPDPRAGSAQGRLCAGEQGPRAARRREGGRDHRGRRRDRRRLARRPVPHRRLPNRLGHQLEHEHQRGDRAASPRRTASRCTPTTT